MKLSEIHLRDPFILPLPASGVYYLFGSTDEDVWRGPGTGFDCYRSRNLESWEGPFPAFRPPTGFWATTQFWAPEVHVHDGRYFMFATFNADTGYRGTQILAADQPEGPYQPWSDRPVTPPHWQCLDGTFHVDEEGKPWIVFCHEWQQVHNGAIYAMRLTPDLKRAVGQPVFLFNASDAPWVRPLSTAHEQEIAGAKTPRRQFPVYVTDGPFLHCTAEGVLLMLWSSFGAEGYTMGIARSASGRVQGPWRHESESLSTDDGGHGMIFRAFDGRLLLTFHKPNVTPDERATLRELAEEGESLRFR